MNKITPLLLSALLVPALAACSQNSEPEKPQSTAAVSPSDEPATDSEPDAALVYGTAALTFREFYSGDVSSTDGYDAVSSATVNKYAIMPNMLTDFKDESTNADGYHITGVQNVSVAVPENLLNEYQKLNPTFTVSDAVPAQYKAVSIVEGKAVYSPTVFNIAATVSDASAELITGSHWGDYQINVTDGAEVHLRNTREDDFDINSEIQGVILETESGLKVGMEYLQSIWVQPYEISWNVPQDNSHNTHISAYDNLSELGKLVGESVNRITYIMPDSTYIYTFDGIYIKPIYSGTISANADADYESITLSKSDFSEFESGTLRVTYTVGSGHHAETTVLLESCLVNGTDTYALNTEALAEAAEGGVYAAEIISDNYANAAVSLPAADAQKQALIMILAEAHKKLEEDPENKVLAAHIEEGEELLECAGATSSQMGSIINELTQLTATKE